MSEKEGIIQKGFNQNTINKKREEKAIKIGKDRRSGILAKRRENLFDETSQISVPNTPLAPANPAIFQQLAEEVKNGDDTQRLNATKTFRRYLSQDVNPPNAYVIATNVLPYFVQFLQCDDNIPLQFEASWALSNIASGTSDDTFAVVSAGAIDQFIRLLDSPVSKIQEQAIWGLANIAGDTRDYSYRDYILKCGIMDHLLNILNSPDSKQSLIATAAWCLSNLCRGRKENRPDFNIISKALPTLATLIDSSSKDIIIDACWAFSFIADGTPEHIDALIELGIVNRVVYLLTSPDFSIQTAALRVTVNIVAGNEIQTQRVLNANVLPILDNLLDSPSKSIKKEALWTLSNITAGTPAQIEAVLKENLFPKIITILTHEAFEIQKEACWTVCNAICGGNKEHQYTIATMNVVEGLCQLIGNKTEVRLLKMIIESLSRVFLLGESLVQSGQWDENIFINQFIDCGGDQLLRAMTFTDDKLYTATEQFISKFFVIDDNEDELNTNDNAPFFEDMTNTNTDLYQPMNSMNTFANTTNTDMTNTSNDHIVNINNDNDAMDM